jgi:two-component system, chemotaxis family, CheB/CheR fusion protein
MTGPRALVVDDHPDSAEAFARLIEALGCTAEFLTDPRVAIERTGQLKPDIVFLDIGMPVLNGHDLARMLREKYGWQVKIVAVTAHSQDEDRALSRQAGFDAHMAKPVDAEAVQSMLVTLFPQMRWR